MTDIDHPYCRPRQGAAINGVQHRGAAASVTIALDMASQLDPTAQDEITARRAVIGRELRQRRQSLEITQVQLARQIGYSRSAVANAEIGYQHADRDFWERCDRALAARGVLTSEHDKITALRQARTDARTLAARSERDAKIAHRRLDRSFGAMAPDAFQTEVDRPDLPAFAHATAMESSLYSAECGGSVDRATIAHLREEVKSLAVRFHELEPAKVLVEARMVRDLAHALERRTGTISQVADLYFIAGGACDLLAIASFDLGLRVSADRQVRAASVYARLLGHSGLMTWSAGTAALIANWSGDPRKALDVIGEAVESGPPGAGMARLRAIEARSWSLVGDAARVDAALGAADSLLEQAGGDDELYDHVGGEFGWGASLHSACAGSALLGVGDADRAVERVRAALAMMREDPYAGLVADRARVDLAVAELAADRFDAVAGALDAVWAVPPQQRRHGLVARMGRLRGDLAGRRWARHRPAGELRERIDQFCDQAVTATLTA